MAHIRANMAYNVRRCGPPPAAGPQGDPSFAFIGLPFSARRTRPGNPSRDSDPQRRGRGSWQPGSSSPSPIQQHLQVAQVILGNIELNITQYTIEYLIQHYSI